MSTTEQQEILNSISSSLARGGVFVTFTYIHAPLLPSGMRFRRLLEQEFAQVTRSKLILANLPPAFVYICVK